MTAPALLARLRGAGLTVAEADGRLALEGPETVLTEALVEEVRGSRDALLAVLRREAERPVPCPCSACSAPGAEAHGPCCYCGPCLDVDPKWEAWRKEAAEELRAAARVSPDLDEEDRALLRACERLDRQRREEGL